LLKKKLYQWRYRFKTFKLVGILYNPGIFNRICFTSSRQQQTFEAFWLSPLKKVLSLLLLSFFFSESSELVASRGSSLVGHA
jgi:hypothetical protein